MIVNETRNQGEQLEETWFPSAVPAGGPGRLIGPEGDKIRWLAGDVPWVVACWCRGTWLFSAKLKYTSFE